MWVEFGSSAQSFVRRTCSPMCTALVAAMLLEPESALAGDELRPMPALAPPGAYLESASDMTPFGVAAPAAPVPQLPQALPAADAEALPARLNAEAVLSLHDLFPDPWRMPFPGTAAAPPLFSSNEPQIRRLEFSSAPQEQRDPRELRRELKRKLSGATMGSGWFAEHIELSFDDGVAYKKNLEWRGMHLRLKVWGPMIKGDPGLGVRVRGLRIGDNFAEVKVRATTDLQDVQLKIEF